MDTSDDSGSAKHSRRNSEQDSLHYNVTQLAIHSPKVDPALRSPSVGSETPTETPNESGQQYWVENIRVIERLRAWLKDRLDTHDYQDEDDSNIKEERRIEDDDEHNLYPVLRAVQEGRE